jgi:oxalate decarboxylase/phosphoglucose isomerase-like protein (cupin superfamily)
MQANVLTLLPAQTGLPTPLTLSQDESGAIRPVFGEGVATAEPVDVRYAQDLSGFLREPGAALPGAALYSVQRGVMPETLSGEMERRGLRYALTVLRAGTVGRSREWVRTRGHHNSLAPGTNLPYPEIHEVLHGDGLLYLQHGSVGHPADVVILPVSAGDKAVVAPGWASLLVNVGEAPLTIGTWRMDDCHTESGELQPFGGMAHFVLRADTGTSSLEPNGRYKAVPEPRRAEPKELPDWGLTRAEPLLAAFHRSPDSLRALLRPQDFADVWKNLYD